MLSALHGSQINRMRNDSRLPDLLEPLIPAMGKNAASAMDKGYPTLRTQYRREHLRGMRQLTEALMGRVDG